MEKEIKIFKYSDLLSILLSENNESLVDLNDFCPDILCVYEKTDMLPLLGENIYIRKTVAEKLCRVQDDIKKTDPLFQLKVVYGYRHPDIQKKYFEEKKEEIKKNNPTLSEKEIEEKTHYFVAVPEVAGHPTGGAVDITITKEGKNLDMGTGIADYSDEEKITTFSKNVSETQKKNRLILHDAMITEGFAPFYGEWWHFSYGDKEWACFYEKNKSLYSPIFLKK